MSTRTIVTFDATPAQRNAVDAALAPHGGVTFLSDLDSPNERVDALAEAEAIISWFPSKELPASQAGSPWPTRLVQLLSAGGDNVPFAVLPPTAAVACNAGAYAVPMAEHVLGLTLALAKRLPQNHRRMESGGFGSPPNVQLQGGVAAIIGLGGAGAACARLFRALGMRVHGINRTGRTHEAVDFIGTLDDLKSVLEVADVAVVTLPLTRPTRGLIGARELGWMKANSTLINVSRGPIVDERALFDHLTDNPGSSAGVDTWWDEPAFGTNEPFNPSLPFMRLPNLLASPHNAGNVPGMLLVATQAAAHNVATFLDGGQPRGILNPLEYL